MNWRPDAFAGNPFERLIKLTHGSMPNNAQPSCSSFPVDIALYRLVGTYKPVHMASPISDLFANAIRILKSGYGLVNFLHERHLLF